MPHLLLQNNEPRSTKKRCRKGGGKWTRSGCLTCKKRRKRCDEAKPSCHTCVRLGLTCEGYGSMWAVPLGPAACIFTSPRSVKQRSPSSSPAPSVGSSVSLAGQTPPTNFSVWSPRPQDSPDNKSSPFTEQSDVGKQDGSSRQQDPVTDNQLVVASPSPSRLLSHLSNLETHYLQYHLEKGSKLLANLETDENPLRSLLIPRALSSPLLMSALCALSAVHFSNRAYYSWSAEAEGAKYYIDTMRGLRSTLTKCQPRSIPEDALLAITLLCKYEIVRGSVKQWAVHLDALQTLVETQGGLTHTDDETTDFIRGMFIYAKNIAKITNRRMPEPSISGLDTISTRKLDIYIGYTEEILKICARIADLPLLSSDPLALGLETKMIDTLLYTWDPTKTPYIIPNGMADATLTRLRLVADSFCDAAYIYLHSTLDRITTISSIQSFSPLTSLSKQTALINLLTRIESHPVNQYCEFSALTFPLFMAGCETSSRQDRVFIMQTLGTLEANFGIRNVKRVKEVLGILWGEDDGNEIGRRHWVDVLEGLGWNLILA
ncbi:fungal-specific transcription factor domain-containing protein [Aspergillus crustosus]